MPQNPDLPDAQDAPRADDLTPDDPPEDAPTGAPTDKKPAVEAPVPAHGEMASAEQLAEGERAVEAAGGGGVDTTGVPPGDGDTGRPRQGATGLGTDDETVPGPEGTARAAEAAGQEVQRR